MTKKIIIGLIIVMVLGVGFYVYSRYFMPIPYENIIYTSISVTDKNSNLLLGNIKIENKKLISNVNDLKIKIFIDKNKDNWEKEELSYPIGGQTITGALWDGSMITTIDDNYHLLSIYVILGDKFDDNYSFELNKIKELVQKGVFKNNLYFRSAPFYYTKSSSVKSCEYLRFYVYFFIKCFVNHKNS